MSLVLFLSIIMNVYLLNETKKFKELSIQLQNDNERLRSDLLHNNRDIDDNMSVFIHISGEVNDPGVYEFKKSKKLFEIIEKAGGFSDKASVENINLVRTVYDGEKVYIPNKNERVISTSTEKEKYININNASKKVLMDLNGIGEAKAKAIIDYRENVSRFSAKEDILEVSGIGPAIYDKIVASIKVN
jgi:competence protein ComEA